MPTSAFSEKTTTPTSPYMQERITDLLVRYWGLGKKLDSDEKSVLLRALDEENKNLRGPIHLRALARLKEQGLE
jgi:hypothetical protein